jgi:hypothetical protein
MIYTKTGLILLDESIESIRSDVEKYAQLPDASEFFIKKQNQLLKNLINSYNYFEQIKHFDFWLHIERIMKQLEAKDPQLSGHIIKLWIKPAGLNFSEIYLNPFAQ